MTGKIKKHDDHKIIDGRFRLITWLGAVTAKRNPDSVAAETRLELLKLGEHLLRDLGFDKEGLPLNSRFQEKGKNFRSTRAVFNPYLGGEKKIVF